MKKPAQPDRLYLTDAARFLGVSRTKLWKLINEGALKTHVDPLDSRKKWIERADLEALKSQSLRAA